VGLFNWRLDHCKTVTSSTCYRCSNAICVFVSCIVEVFYFDNKRYDYIFGWEIRTMPPVWHSISGAAIPATFWSAVISYTLIILRYRTTLSRDCAITMSLPFAQEFALLGLVHASHITTGEGLCGTWSFRNDTKLHIFWDVMPCRLVTLPTFRRSAVFSFSGSSTPKRLNPDDAGTTLLRNVGNYLSGDMAFTAQDN
jgi:hypothetical protein